jgi:hypothetical protein
MDGVTVSDPAVGPDAVDDEADGADGVVVVPVPDKGPPGALGLAVPGWFWFGAAWPGVFFPAGPGAALGPDCVGAVVGEELPVDEVELDDAPADCARATVVCTASKADSASMILVFIISCFQLVASE